MLYISKQTLPLPFRKIMQHQAFLIITITTNGCKLHVCNLVFKVLLNSWRDINECYLCFENHLFLIHQTGLCHVVVYRRKDRYCPSGCESERYGNIEGELLILSEYSTDIYPPTDLRSPLFLSLHIVPCFPLGKSSQLCQLNVNRCVLRVWGMQVCGNLQTFICTATKHHCHSRLAASKNKYADC